MPSVAAGGAAGAAADGACGGKEAWNPVSKNHARRSIPSRFCRVPRSKKASRRWWRHARAGPTRSALWPSKRRACRLLPAMVRRAPKTSLRQTKANRMRREPLTGPGMSGRIPSRRGKRQTESGRVGQDRRPPPRPRRGCPTPARWNGNSNSASAEPEQPHKPEPAHPVETVTEKPANPRRGWWQRLIQS